MKPSYAEASYRRRLLHAYSNDQIDAGRFEELTAHVVAGGHLDRHLRPTDHPEPGSALAAEIERERRNGGPRPGQSSAFASDSTSDVGP